MKNTLYDGYQGPRLPREVQVRRMRRVMEEALTPLEREALTAYYFHKRKIVQIARERGVNKSTASRNLHRAERKLREYLRY